MKGRKVEKTVTKRKKFTISLLILILFSFLTNGLIAVIPIIKIAEAGDIISFSDSTTRVTVTIISQEPRINWYDLQNSTGDSKLNEQIEVNQEYKFCINISNDLGWAYIDYINITAWYDNGSENSTYNNSGNLGGNLNMFLQYENTTGIASYNKLWPKNEVTKGNLTEIDVKNINSNSTNSTNSTEKADCHNISFWFTPGYQFRYAPGDGSWYKTDNATEDIWSWNFNIAVTTGGENVNESYTTRVVNEFGVYSYSEIASAGMPYITGVPGRNATTNGSVSITTRSNSNYSLSVNVDTFVYTKDPALIIPNTAVWVRGGDLATFSNFNGIDPIYLYGPSSAYSDAEDDNTSKITDNIDYKCSVPLGQLPGDYNTTIHYLLKTEV